MSDCPEISCDCSVNNNLDYSLQNYPLSYNDEMTFFIPCPEGFSCALPGVQITIPAGSIAYRPTTASGNNSQAAQQYFQEQGEQRANQQAIPQLQPRPRVYYNVTYVAACEPDQIGVQGSHPFFTGVGQVTVPGGVFSAATQAEANALAAAYAASILNAQANCHWVNDEVTIDCSSMGAFGGPIIVPAGTFSSTVSKEDANSQALTYAESQIATTCFWASQEVTLPCPDSALGGPIIVPAGTFESFVSQEDADAQAQAFAESQVGTTCYWDNEEQTVNCPDGETGGPFTVPAGTYQSFVSQADANATALADAEAQAAAGCSSCTDYPVSGLSWSQNGPFGGGSTGSASGGSGSVFLDGTANDNCTLEACLPNSCNAYQISIDVSWNLSANPGFFPPFPFPPPISFLQVSIDEVLVLDQNAASINGGAVCSNNTGNITLTHMIEPDSYSDIHGCHKISFNSGQDPLGGACTCSWSFSITPLTPP